MAIIPLSLKLSWYDPSQPTGVVTAVNDNVNQATTAATQYTMQDIIDTVSFTGGAIDGSGTANEIAVFTDTNTIDSISNGTSGQLLVSNGAGSDPSFQTVATGVPSSEHNLDANSYALLDGVFLDGSEWLVFQFGFLYATLSTEPDGQNEIVSVPNDPAGVEIQNPLNYGIGFGPNPGSSYSKYDIVLNPFKYAEFGTGGAPAGWACGSVNVGDPQYIWTNVMVPLGYSPTQPGKPVSTARFIGEVVCSNGVVPIQMAQYISCDVTTLAFTDLMGWVGYVKSYGFDFANNVGVNKITIFFAGPTTAVTVV